MRLDDLDALLIGFPKTGTTSLAGWLDGAGRVRVSSPKETFALCPEFAANHRRAGGLSLADAFPGVPPSGDGVADGAADRPALIEASTLNVYSEALRTEAARTDVRVVVMVRDHARAVESWHEQMVFAGDMPACPLAEAWARGGDGSRQASSPARLKANYRLMFRQAWWIERWVRGLGHERVLVLGTDDLADHEALAALLSGFLGVELGELGPVDRSNARLRRSARWLRHLKAPALRRGVALIDRTGALERGLRRALRRAYAAPAGREPELDEALRAEISEHFRRDAERLAELRERNRSVHRR